jgi:hypothetical protein
VGSLEGGARPGIENAFALRALIIENWGSAPPMDSYMLIILAFGAPKHPVIVRDFKKRLETDFLNFRSCHFVSAMAKKAPKPLYGRRSASFRLWGGVKAGEGNLPVA